MLMVVEYILTARIRCLLKGNVFTRVRLPVSRATPLPHPPRPQSPRPV